MVHVHAQAIHRGVDSCMKIQKTLSSINPRGNYPSALSGTPIPTKQKAESQRSLDLRTTYVRLVFIVLWAGPLVR